MFMEYDSPKQINGINLADYYPERRSYNSVVWVHRKYLEKSKKEKKIEKEKKEKEAKEAKEKKTLKKKPRSVKCDKCEQCNDIECNNELLGINNSLLLQSLQYAKTLVPIVMPSSDMVSPVYYTIKASKKSKDIKKKRKPETSAHTHTLKKEKSKKIIETYRNNAGKESMSVKETISSYHSDTLDELHINPSLCCTLSEISEHKPKKEKCDKPKQTLQKIFPSESFEAMATEFFNTSTDTKIKIHLMNETEKNLLTDNIRVPVLNAIRDCISELNSQKHNPEFTTVQKYVKCNSQKLDNVMDKLTCVERKLDQYIRIQDTKYKTLPNKAVMDKNLENKQIVDKNIVDKNIADKNIADKNEVDKLLTKPKSPRVRAASTLEQLGEDIMEIEQENSFGLEIRGEYSSDEYYQKPSLSARRRKCKNSVVQLHTVKHLSPKEIKGGGGEEASAIMNSSSGQLVKPDRPNRIPARFCWTDAAKKNAP